jgi:beta-phosphoglucomutase-like phosphatase (HAD superfamily)
MAINGFKAIIFDMDGLLVDSEIVWYGVEKFMIEARGHEYTDEVRDSIIGMRVDEFLQNLHDHYGLEESVEELKAELTERMLDVIPKQVMAQPGAKELVQPISRRRAIAHSISCMSSTRTTSGVSCSIASTMELRPSKNPTTWKPAVWRRARRMA